jgi:hypothetical protein
VLLVRLQLPCSATRTCFAAPAAQAIVSSPSLLLLYRSLANIPRPSPSTVRLLNPSAVNPPNGWVFGKTVPISDTFEMGKKLGEGGHFGFCKLATEKKTGKVYAIKHILKQR